VAIKVLPSDIAASVELRERFEREGRAISQLSHPHICVLHDIGAHAPSNPESQTPLGTPKPGSTEAGEGGNPVAIHYLVMEHLEGETLAARLTRGPLPLDQALTLAVQVCGALDAAHRQGIVHRDLKPANVMLTRTGAKLLDFGLARQSAVVTTDATATVLGAVPGPAAALTGQGTILGTVQYMSPEQIEGKPIDARADIWAFGCLLYETLTGAPAFSGGSPASLIASILTHDPASVATLQPSTPVAVSRLIRTCLEKDPADRWQTSRDLLRELRWAQETPQAAPFGGGTGAPPPVPGRRWWVPVGVAALALAFVSFAWLWSGRDTPAAPAAPAGPPVVVLMDSTHPQRVYDDETRKAGGTNADDLTDLLRDLPVLLVKENTNWSWHREDELLRQKPALVVVHRSCFFDATFFPDADLSGQTYPFAADKFELFMGYVGLGNPRTKFIVYSRRSWDTQAARDKWVADVEQRFPGLRGRVQAWMVPLERPTFRNPQTGAEIKTLVKAALGLDTPASQR
jgi:hypothetical protein